MKKIVLISAMAAAMLSTSAFAECNKKICNTEAAVDLSKDYTVVLKDTTGKEFIAHISDIKKDIHIGLASSNVMAERTADWSVGAGVSAVVEDKLYLGANVDLGLVNVHSDTMPSALAELKAGYVVNSDIVGYGLVGIKAIDYNGKENAVGLGYGIGAEYAVCPKTALALEYKMYDMTAEKSAPDYNHESLGLKAKFYF